jgi:hypothetical protein
VWRLIVADFGEKYITPAGRGCGFRFEVGWSFTIA